MGPPKFLVKSYLWLLRSSIVDFWEVCSGSFRQPKDLTQRSGSLFCTEKRRKSCKIKGPCKKWAFNAEKWVTNEFQL